MVVETVLVVPGQILPPVAVAVNIIGSVTTAETTDVQPLASVTV